MLRRSAVVAEWLPTTRAACVVSLLVVIAMACGAHRLDRDVLEAEVASRLLAEHPGAVAAVSCPDVRDPVDGASFVCAAQLGAQIIELPVVVELVDGVFESTVRVDDRLVAADQIAVLLAETFTDEVGSPTEVDCGQPVIALAIDATVDCVATDQRGIERTFAVRIDDLGEVSIELQ